MLTGGSMFLGEGASTGLKGSDEFIDDLVLKANQFLNKVCIV